MGLFDRLIKRKQKQNYKPLVIYGLCGPVGVGAHKSGEARYWTASIILRAWKEEGSEALHEEKIRLEKTCDEDGVHALQEQLRKNAIFHAKVRMSEQGLELLELLEPDCDEPQLAALRGVQEDARTETAVDPEVAEGRCRIQTFAKEKTRVYFEGKQEEGIRILHAMQKRQVGWYNDAVNYAADRAVPKYNETLRSGERKLTKKAFREQVRLAKIVIGLARGILMVLQAGSIIDTIVYYMSLPLSFLPAWLSAVCMLVLQTFLNFLIPSGSGQAATSMPIMAPLADLLGLHRDVAVLAFQFGDGLSNIVWPTGFAAIMSGLAGVKIQKWWKFVVPAFLGLFATQCVLMVVAVIIGFGG